ncbi:tonB-dependent Receptor Plug domain protein [Bacteroides fragilis str. 2-F-2 |nr:tonB-dependent Receptor Plug domain protein [Bacteroides fragilis str. 2-F-2 \
MRADVDFSARLKEEKGRSFWDVSLGLRDSSGEPLGGTLSVSVTDDRYALQDTTVNILSSFLLSSDLQGYVEAPSFYFSGDDSRTSYLLDLLMLTQGWVKYSLVPDYGFFPVERSQCVSGKVVSEYSEKKCIADAVVTLFSFDKKIMRQTTSDASGCFRFDSLSFPRGTHFILQARKKKGGTDVALLVDRDSVPSVHSSLPVYADWFRAEMDEPVVPEQSGNDPSPTSANVFQRSSTVPFSMEQYLDEVVVSTKKIEKKKQYAIESLMAHSDWNKTYHVDEMTLSPYSSTKDLLINTPGVGWAVDSNSGEEFFYISRLGGQALLMIDGFQATYSELAGMPVSLVESVELIKDVAQMSLLGGKALNGVIMISTKSDWTSVNRASNFRVVQPKGYQVKREFYSPFYSFANNKRANGCKTIYWSPDLLLDKAASHLEFGAPLISLTIVIQGITSSGELVNFIRILKNEQ